ncbi:MAG TPA: nucleotide exchange factor GrpE [Patescibacteria group bacterium]|jgi:molecular chaperone GrpE|nr:nucleotide exchange factor GrpE [Patescibacteria group bacterium]
MTESEPETDPLAPQPEEGLGPEGAPAPIAEDGQDPSAARIKLLEEEVARMKDHLLRAMAETENTRKRAQRDREDAGKYAITGFAKDMLDFADNFHRALAAIPAEMHGDERIGPIITGIESMEKVLTRNLEKHGITKIEPMGVPFDANFHEVIFEAPGTGKPAGTIIQVVEAGYLLKDRLLRPARVGVAKGDGPATGGKVDTQA